MCLTIAFYHIDTKVIIDHHRFSNTEPLCVNYDDLCIYVVKKLIRTFANSFLKIKVVLGRKLRLQTTIIYLTIIYYLVLFAFSSFSTWLSFFKLL